MLFSRNLLSLHHVVPISCCLLIEGMTFLNPFVLIGLAAAAIPIILHLLNLRKLRTIEFSTLSFLKELQQTKIRRLKLRQLLLLLIRTLLVIFIVLAFARPALRGTILGTIGTNARSTVVFIFDDSFSETVSDEHGERLKRGKESTLKLIDLLGDGDEAFLIKLSELPNVTVEPALHDFTALRELVAEIQSSPVRRPMETALRTASRLLAQSRNANKEIYVISDFQRSLFSERMSEHAEPAGTLLDEHVSIFLVPLAKKDAANVAVDSVTIITTILEKDKPVEITARLRNFSNVALHNYVASISLDAVRASQLSVNMEPYGSATLKFLVSPKRSGFIQGFVELEHDALDLDNRRYFSMRIPERIRTVVIASSSAESRYPLLALQAGNGEQEHSLISIIQTVPQKFSLIDLTLIDVVVCSNILALHRSDVERLRGFVKRGGGLILFPGSEGSQAYVQAASLASLHLPPVKSVVRVPAGQAPIEFRNLDFDHPLFATVFDREQRSSTTTPREIESPKINVILDHEAGREGRTIISTNNGGVFLSEHQLGTGRILFYSVDPALTWSDFPLKGLFAPLVYRSVVYTALRNEESNSHIVGDEPPLAVSSNMTSRVNGQYKLIGPDGVEELLKPTSSPHGSTATSSVQFSPKRLILPGIYGIVNGTTILRQFAINIDPRESDLRIADDRSLDEFWQRLGIASSAVHTLSQDEQLQASVVQSRYGVELWKYCIILAILLSLLEMAIARDSRKAVNQLA